MERVAFLSRSMRAARGLDHEAEESTPSATPVPFLLREDSNDSSSIDLLNTSGPDPTLLLSTAANSSSASSSSVAAPSLALAGAASVPGQTTGPSPTATPAEPIHHRHWNPAAARLASQAGAGLSSSTGRLDRLVRSSGSGSSSGRRHRRRRSREDGDLPLEDALHRQTSAPSAAPVAGSAVPGSRLHGPRRINSAGAGPDDRHRRRRRRQAPSTTGLSSASASARSSPGAPSLLASVRRIATVSSEPGSSAPSPGGSTKRTEQPAATVAIAAAASAAASDALAEVAAAENAASPTPSEPFLAAPPAHSSQPPASGDALSVGRSSLGSRSSISSTGSDLSAPIRQASVPEGQSDSFPRGVAITSWRPSPSSSPVPRRAKPDSGQATPRPRSSSSSDTSGLLWLLMLSSEERRCYDEYYTRERGSRLGVCIVLVCIISLAWGLFLVSKVNDGENDIGISDNFVRRVLASALLLGVAAIALVCLILLARIGLDHKQTARYGRTGSLLLSVLFDVIILAVILLHPDARIESVLVVVLAVTMQYTLSSLSLASAIAICLTLSVLDCVFALVAIDTSLDYAYLREDYDTNARLVWGLSRVLVLTFANVFGIVTRITVDIVRRATYNVMRELVIERERVNQQKYLSEKILETLMPEKAARWLLDHLYTPRSRLPLMREMYMDYSPQASVLFGDIVGFTKLSAMCSARQLVNTLNSLFAEFDKLAATYHCEKIKVVGDCYFCVAGVLVPRQDHARCCVEMGFAMIQKLEEFKASLPLPIQIRVGVHTGGVISGVLGSAKYQFDVWSNTVNIANALESSGIPGKIHVSENTLAMLPADFEAEPRTFSSLVPKPPSLEDMHTFILKDRSSVHFQRASTLAQDIEIAFQAFDTDNTGFVSKEMLKAGLEKMGANVPEDELAAIYTEFDGDGDGSLSLVEFRQAFERRQALFDSSLISALVQRSFGMEDRGKFSISALRDFLQVKTHYQDFGLFWNPTAHFQALSLFFRDLRLEYTYRHSRTRFAELAVALGVLVLLIANVAILVQSHYAVDGRCDSVHWTILAAMFLVQVLAAAWLYPHALPKGIAARLNALNQMHVSHALVGLVCIVLLQFNALFALRCADVPVCCSRRSVLRLSNPSAPPTAVCFGDHGCYFSTNATAPTCMSDDALCPEGGNNHPDLLVMAFAVAVLASFTFFKLSTIITSTLSGLSVLIFCVIVLGVKDTEFDFEAPGPDHGSDAQIPLFLCLLWLMETLVARQFEYISRVNFWHEHMGQQHLKQSRALSTQYDDTLRQIMPAHVADRLRQRPEDLIADYIEDVGIMFANTANFEASFFSEDFMFGKECIRILNEIVCDFDELIDTAAYPWLDKIKTINSSYMVASGLHCKEQAPEAARQVKTQGLVQLADFALRLIDVMEEFNRHTVGNEFVLRIGINFGPVVAGVIGTDKLYYDVWGDTVNVASRMESTGEKRRIHVSQAAMEVLKDTHRFSEPVQTPVKGKGMMTTYYLLGRLAQRQTENQLGPVSLRVDAEEDSGDDDITDNNADDNRDTPAAADTHGEAAASRVRVLDFGELLLEGPGENGDGDGDDDSNAGLATSSV